jgi:hypothetical protein
VLAGGYAVEVSALLQNAKFYKDQGIEALNKLLHSAVTEVKGRFDSQRRKLLEYAPMDFTA